MEAYNISSREADVAYLECVQATQSYNDYMDAFYFEEAGEGNDQNIVQKLIEKIKSLAAAIAKFFSDFFASAKAKLFKQKADEALEDKELAAKKVEVLDAGRIVKFTKGYQKRISEAKSVEEIDKIVAEYEKKRNVAGVFAVTATIAAAIGVYVHHAQNHIKKAKEVNDYGQALLAKEQKAMAAQLAEGRKVHQGAKDYAKETGTKYDPKGLLDASAGYQAAKHRTEELRAEREAYKNSKGYKKYVANEPSKLERLAARKANAIAKVTSDGMNAVKGAFTGGISKITGAISGVAKKASNAASERKAAAEDKSFKNLVGAKTESAEDDDFGEGSYFFGEIQMESGDMSTEDLFGVDPFSESADELFEESSLSDIGSKIQSAIKKIIEKIKKLYADLKDKFAAAKYAAVLRSQAASSTRQIKFNMRDKEITKTVKELMIASNKGCIEAKKVEQAYLRGKITTDQMYDKLDVIETDLDREIDRIMNSPYGKSVQSKLEDTYAASRVQSYCQKLLNYQQKTTDELAKSINNEEYRLLKEAAELERAQAQAAKELAAEAKRKASIKYKLAQWYARTNKKVLGSIVTAIGVASAIGAFAAKLSLNKKSKAVHESVEDEAYSEVDPFDEAADVASAFEDASFMEEASEEYDEAYLEAVESALAFEYGVDLDSEDSYLEDADDFSDDADSLFTEGAGNQMIRDYFKEAFDTYKTEVKAGRKEYKSKNYDKAVKHISKAKKAMEGALDKIRDVDDSIGDAISGMFVQGLINCAKLLVVTLATFGILTYVESLKQCISHWVGVVDDFKQGNTAIRHWFNTRRSSTIGDAKMLVAICDSMIKQCENAKKRDQNRDKNSAKEESVEDDLFGDDFDEFTESAEESILGDEMDELFGLI